MGKVLLKGVDATESKLLNDNILVVGSSGSGKTTLFVDAQIMNAGGSIVVADTKSNLYKRHKEALEEKGYKVIMIDFIDLDKSTYGFNPLGKLEKQGKDYSIEDVRDLALTICERNPDDRDPFWVQSAQMMIEAYIMLTLEVEVNPKVPSNLRMATSFMSDFSVQYCQGLLSDIDDGSSKALSAFNRLIKVADAERTLACIYQFAFNAMKSFDSGKMYRFFIKEKNIDFTELSENKTAVFLNISDTDRTNDKLVDLFYMQLFKELIRYADLQENSRLSVPVNVIFDDFATNTFIADFADIISVIRSRGISVSIILQSLSQLQSKYSKADAKTIMNNCDRCIYLGANEFETIDYFSSMADKPVSSLINMPLDTAVVFERGYEPRKVIKSFDFE